MAERDINILIRASDSFSSTIKKANDALTGMMMPITALNQGVQLVTSTIGLFNRAITDMISPAAEAEEVYNRLKNAIELTGQSYADVKESVVAFTAEMQNNSRFNDEEAARVLQKMTQLTSSLGKGMQGARLALDMAASGIFDVDTAARMLSQAMEGNVEVLGRYIPELKASAKHITDNMSAAEKWAIAQEILNQKFSGMARNDLDTFNGQMQRFRNQVSDISEIGGNVFLPFLKDMAGYLADSATKIKDFLDTTSVLNNAAYAILKMQAETMAETGASIEEFKPGGKYYIDMLSTFKEHTEKLQVATADATDKMGMFNKACEDAGKRISKENELLKNNNDEVVIAIGLSGQLTDTWRNLTTQAERLALYYRNIGLILSSDVADKQMRETRKIIEAQEAAAIEFAGYIDSLQLSKYQFLMNMGDMMMGQTSQLSSGLANIMMGGKNRLKDIFKDMAKDFITFFINQALQAVAGIFVAKLLTILGSLFDTPANDAMAARQGADFARHFTSGMDKYFKGANLAGMITGHTRYAGAMGGGGSVVVNIQGNIIGDSDYIVKQIEKAVDTGRSRLQITGGNRVFQY